MSDGIPLTRADRITIPVLNNMKSVRHSAALLSIYDHCHASRFDQAGGHVIIVGDSVEMVVYGMPNTKSATMDKMLFHTQAVRRGTNRLFVVADMPLGSYEPSNQVAIENAAKFMRVDANAVKIETNLVYMERVEATACFCPVFSHIGLNPNKADMLGGYKTTGKTINEAKELCKLAQESEKAGATAVLIESAPEEVTQTIRDILNIPVYCIAGGRGVDGQLLISYDLLDLYAWHGNRKPRHFKTYKARENGVTVGELTTEAFAWYVEAVKNGEFPGEENAHFLPNKTPKEKEEREEILKYLKTLR